MKLKSVFLLSSACRPTITRKQQQRKKGRMIKKEKDKARKKREENEGNEGGELLPRSRRWQMGMVGEVVVGVGEMVVRVGEVMVRVGEVRKRG